MIFCVDLYRNKIILKMRIQEIIAIELLQMFEEKVGNWIATAD